MGHPLLLLCSGGGVHGKGLAPRADEPAVLKLTLVIQRFLFNLADYIKLGQSREIFFDLRSFWPFGLLEVGRYGTG